MTKTKYTAIIEDIYWAKVRSEAIDSKTITESFYLDSKQEAKVFEALEIGEDVVSGTEPGFPNVIIIEGDAKVIDTTIYNSLKAIHRILQDVV
ncbi:hypothetical protein DKX38_027060 [Salix brachista]|uniref:Uncharacterized protein n=1 Tax=Salix brachista TaxID=2182728 RepID=A0A5N5JC35_9ROSI|nr:hypothetical protein DKX38_027060 [Salix brachista]